MEPLVSNGWHTPECPETLESQNPFAQLPALEATVVELVIMILIIIIIIIRIRIRHRVSKVENGRFNNISVCV
jgi:hypothetical protein